MTDCIPAGPPDAAVIVFLAVWAGLALLTVAIAREAPFSGRGFLIATHAAMLGWLAAAALELWSDTEACKLVFALAAWPFIAGLPTLWAFFLHAYAFGRSGRVWRLEWAALLGGPLAITGMALTNGWHELFYGPGTMLVEIDGRGAVRYDHGPLFFMAAAYLYVFQLAALLIAAAGVWFANRAYRRHFAVLLAITLLPITGNLAYILGGVTLLGFDPTPFMFSMVLLLLAWMIGISRPFDLANVGRDVLFFTARDPVVMIDPDGIVMAANPAAEQLLAAPDPARPAADSAPSPTGSLRRGRHVPAGSPIAPIADAIAARGIAPAASRIALDGRSHAVRVLPVERPLARQSPRIGWLIWLTDISELVGLQDELSAERDFLAQLLDTDLSSIVAFDDEGRIVFANPAAEAVLGLPEGGSRGLRFDDPRWGLADPGGTLIDPATAPVALALRDKAALRDHRISVRRPDGARRVLSLNATPIPGPGSPARVVVSMVDITEALRAEAALRDAVARAEAANEAKSRFLANMSHEIRTPLNGVLGMAEVLEGSITDPAQRQMVRTIRDSGAMLLHLLNDVLDFSKIETGKLSLESVALVPAELARGLVALHAPRAAEKGLEFRLETAPGSEAPRMGDPHRIMQVLHNLVGNALKFTEAGEVVLQLTIDETAGRGAGRVVFAVRDTGIGMTEAQQARLFEDFEQADSSITRRFGGTGLGMAIVRRLIDRMEGEIEVISTPGAGTEVRVALPLPLAPAPAGETAPPPAAAAGDRASPLQGPTADVAAAPPAGPGAARADSGAGPRSTGATKPATGAGPALAGLRILAADDSATNRMVLRAMLARLGAKVALVEDGAQALAAFEPGRFDLILLDISMPVMDGLAALAGMQAKAGQAGITLPPALAITANVLPDQVGAYLAAGFSGHVGKPLSGEDLQARILAALDRAPPAP